MLRGIVQFDTLNEVNIRLSDGSKAFNYDGYTNIIFKVLKADGTAYIASEGENVIATSPVDGIITVNLTGQSTTAAGLCQSVLEIYSGDGKMTTARFNYEVFEDLDLDEAVESTTEYPALQNLLMDLSELEASIEAAEAARVTAEAARASAASGYVAKAEGYAISAADDANAARAYAAQAKAIAGGDYAPAGYGWGTNGETMTAPSLDGLQANADGCTATGLWSAASRTPSNPDGVGTWWYIKTEAFGKDIRQTALGNIVASGYPMSGEAVRVRQAGVWKPWEWVNPPMLAGVEYRTTERFMGKPVYAKLVDTGVAPSNSENWVTLKDKDGNDIPISHLVAMNAEVRADNTHIYSVPPYNEDLMVFFSRGSNESSVIVRATTNSWAANSYRVYVMLKYIKTTDT